MPPEATNPLDPGVSVLRYALERHASRQPEAVFAVFEDEPGWTFGQTRGLVRRTAKGLRRLGVRPGDAVLVMLPNCGLALRVMFAVARLVPQPIWRRMPR